ncbi:MAG: hypothetical protein ACTHMM_21970 [Agriterribacter sp.]
MQDIQVPKHLIFLNVGEPNSVRRRRHEQGIEKHAMRNWDNCREFGFISAGQGKRWSDQLGKAEIDDIVCAYVTERGFVGIGQCWSESKPIRDYKSRNGKSLRELPLYPTNIFLNCDSLEKCEYIIGVDWFEGLVVSKEKAKSVKGLSLGVNSDDVDPPFRSC